MTPPYPDDTRGPRYQGGESIDAVLARLDQRGIEAEKQQDRILDTQKDIWEKLNKLPCGARGEALRQLQDQYDGSVDAAARAAAEAAVRAVSAEIAPKPHAKKKQATLVTVLCAAVVAVIEALKALLVQAR